MPCRFKEDAKNLAWLDLLDAGNGKKVKRVGNDGTLEANSKVDIPLWLAISLAQRDVVEMKNPLFLSENYLNLIKSGAEVVNFRHQSHHIYENLLKLCSHLAEDQVFSYVTIYQRAFIERFVKSIIEMADSSDIQ